MAADGSARRRTGRAAGSPRNRDAILAAARREFGENGFEGTTVRKIAAGAGVDVALVYHYFASKDQLLLESLHDARSPVLIEVLDGDPERIGERLLRQALAVYDDGDALVGLIRAASTHEEAAKALREGIGEGELIPLLKALGQPQPEVRAALIASVLVGLTTTRSIVRAGALVAADHDALVAWYAPTIQRYLTEPLPGS